MAQISSLGRLFTDQGKLDEAEPLLRESLDGKREVLGNKHPDTLAAVSAAVYSNTALGLCSLWFGCCGFAHGAYALCEAGCMRGSYVHVCVHACVWVRTVVVRCCCFEVEVGCCVCVRGSVCIAVD